ncbi:MAG: amino acid adenylation domain-containing protein [Candidatus Binataceae bacterium]|nr:amino acid adenylation domain-containing protein [Candidatus Binataceae bacterium]
MSDEAKRIADLSPTEKRALLADLIRQKMRGPESFYPLSYNQQGIWFLSQLAPENMVYNVSFAARITSELNVPALRRSFQKLVDRHPSLRTTFSVQSGKPAQQVHHGAKVHFEELDASTWPRDEMAPRLADEAHRPFDLEQGPLLRVSVYRRSAREHYLLLVVHHIVIDFWSLAILLNELGVLYPAEAAGMRATLPPLDLQYGDYVRWQSEALAGAEGGRLWSYWRKQLAGQLPVLDLPTDRPRQPTQSHRGGSHDFVLNDELSGRLRALAKAQGATLYVVMLAVFQAMLHCLSRQDDLVVGSPVVGRSRAEFEEIVGLFTNPVFLRVNLSGDPTFQELLCHVRQTVLAALEHQDFPTLLLVERLRPARDLSRPPICQVMFVLDKPHGLAEQGAPTFVHGETGPTMNSGGLILESFPLEHRSASLDLVLLVVESTQSLSISMRYNAELFDHSTIIRFGKYFETLLGQVANQPQVRLSGLAELLAATDPGRLAARNDVRILEDSERERILVEFNQTASPFPDDVCIHRLFEEQVERTPERVALTFENQHLTYAQVNARANQLAHYLRGRGVGPEARVAICMERCVEMVVALLGILKAGAAYLPIDPAYPKQRLAFTLEDAGARMLLTMAPLRERMPEQGVHLICLDTESESIARENSANPLILATAGNLAYVIYTSGSTGQPKGVMVEHRGLSNTVKWLLQTLAITPDDITFLKTPITFDAAGREIFPTLLAGGRLIIAEPNAHRDSRYIAEHIRDQGITILHCVPSFLRFLAAESAFADAVSLRAVMSGGEALAPDVVAEFGRRSRAALYNVYGPTETIIDSAYWLCEGTSDTSIVPIGRPIPNARMYILDTALRPVPISVAGELYIGGVSLARGYLNRPGLTAEKFIPDPFSSEPGKRLYKTGDLARYLPDGNIQYAGRSDYQVKIRGFRIELGEIEAALAQHPSVAQTIITMDENARGEGRLVAYVVAQPRCAPTAAELRTFLKDHLPEHMVPAVFMPLDSFPLTTNGKIDRRGLPSPGLARPELDKAFVGFTTPTEGLLADIWSRVLGVERVGIHDDFFELGGHSLLATQVVSRIRELFQVEMPLRRLFETPTVAGLAESLELLRRDGQSLTLTPIQRVPRDRDLPLSFAQQRLWFIDQLDPGNSVYNFPVAVRLKGSLNVAALKQSLNEIVRRHEALRTTFAMADGQPIQIIAPSLSISLPTLDLGELTEVEREDEVNRLVVEEARRPFDLAQGPLVRAKVLRLADDEQVGLLTMHHIVSDGWSTGILIREMAALYQAYCSENPSPLPELSIQYADFAQWQREWLQGAVLERQVDYWKQQLAGAPPLLDLPEDHPRPAVQTFRGGHQSLLLPKELGGALSTLSSQEAATLFMTLLAAFKVLLRCYTRQEDIVVGTPVANRNRIEIEGLIGFFVNALVLRTDLSGNPTFRELVRRERKVCVDAYAHQDLPFEKLVEALHIDRDLSRNPLFQVMFVLQNSPVHAVALPGLSLTPVIADGGTTHFDLTLHVVDSDRGLVVTAAYNTDLFDAGTISRMLSHYQILLEAIVRDPDQRLSDLSLVSNSERQQALLGCDDSSQDYIPPPTIHELFEAQVERTPDAIALVFEDQQLSYCELNVRANRLAHSLRKLNVGPEVAVGVCLERSLEVVVSLLGILKAGGVYLPLDPAYPKQRIGFMLEDSKAAVLLTQTRLIHGLPEHWARVVDLDTDSEATIRESAENPTSLIQPDNLAYIIYTSGSTGQPKGVLVSHGSIAEHCCDAEKYYDLKPTDRVLQLASMSFDLSLEQILPTLIAGARLVVVGQEVWRANEFHSKAAEFGLTVVDLPTGYWQELIQEWAAGSESDLSAPYRLFLVGGDAMSPEAFDLWRQSPLGAIRLINAYGPTEATITATAFETGSLSHNGVRFHRVPIGRPLANREIYILDRDYNPVPIGVPGELHIGGRSLARGYLNRPDLTADKFVPNPFSHVAGARMYKTGDVARQLADGNIEYIGRTDHQVKIRGFRIELGEVEAALAQHPFVHQAIVSTHQDGRGEKRMVAYVLGDHEHAPTANDLRCFLKDRVPEYMVPSVFMLLESMPLMPNGKVDRGALPKPDQTRPEMGKIFVAPRDELERQLTALWEEVLGVRPIGVTDNFFELGGHSLLAVRLFALIDKRLGKRLPLAALFQGATVEGLAAIVRQNSLSAAPSSLVPIQPLGKKRPLFLVHPAGGHVFPFIGLVQCLGSDQPCYGLQARGVEEGQEAHTRIEDMAACYIQAIQSVQPEGPYLLGGWSMGGEIAFEMAQQLYARGQKVALLALLDARIPSTVENVADEDFEAMLLADVIRYFDLSADLGKGVAFLPPGELLARVLEQGKSAGLIPPDIEADQAHRLIELCKSDFRASRNYVLHRYPGRVTLFKANENPSGNAIDSTLGWSDWADEGVDVHIVPGNHATMIYKPNVETLAAKLAACIEQVQPDLEI